MAQFTLHIEKQHKISVKMVRKKLLKSSTVRSLLADCAKPVDNVTYMQNRNPRNLEMMRIGYRPDGYHLEMPGKSFWHK